MKLIKTTTMAILFSGLLLCVTASANNEQGKVTSEKECISATITATSTENFDDRLDRANKAIKVCLKVAEAGSLKVQEALMVLYMNIDDLKESAKWARKAIDNGSVPAQRALGVLYFEGYGVEKDRQQAKKWLTKACNNKDQLACDTLKEYNLN